MTNSNIILQATGLSKRYPRRGPQPEKWALQDLDLTVYEGEIFGYLGPNGAGKTTTIRLMLNLMQPTRGDVRLLGKDVRQYNVQIKQAVGNLPSEVRLWDNLSGLQILRYLSALRPGCDFRYALALAERLQLNLNVRARNYSTGNKRKLGIVQAFMHRPRLLILDEPTMGLDPLVRQTFNDMVIETRNEGNTVFLSSHVLSEVEAVCDRVGVLRDGRLQALEKLTDLKTLMFRWVSVHTPVPLYMAEWEAIPGVSDVTPLPDGVRFRLSGMLDPVVKLAARYPITDMKIEEPDLEDFFMSFYGKAAPPNV